MTMGRIGMWERLAWRWGWQFRRDRNGHVYMIFRRIEWMPAADGETADRKEG
jgi:hypothetical protein